MRLLECPIRRRWPPAVAGTHHGRVQGPLLACRRRRTPPWHPADRITSGSTASLPACPIRVQTGRLAAQRPLSTARATCWRSTVARCGAPTLSKPSVQAKAQGLAATRVQPRAASVQDVCRMVAKCAFTAHSIRLSRQSCQPAWTISGSPLPRSSAHAIRPLLRPPPQRKCQWVSGS